MKNQQKEAARNVQIISILEMNMIQGIGVPCTAIPCTMYSHTLYLLLTNLSACYAEWEILVDGKNTRKGIIENLNVAPRQTRKIQLGYSRDEISNDKEILLNMAFKLKKAETLLPAGHIIAKNQLTIHPYQAPELADLSDKLPSNPWMMVSKKTKDIQNSYLR